VEDQPASPSESAAGTGKSGSRFRTYHGPTRAYTSRRIAQGKSQRKIRRCLKRTVARQLYRLLERTATTEPGRWLTAPSGKTAPGKA
jgi:hypothetical protein